MGSDVKKLVRSSKRRRRTLRRIKLVLFSLGLCSGAIGLALCGSFFLSRNSRVGVLGLGYVAFSAALLAIRAVMVWVYGLRKVRPSGRRVRTSSAVIKGRQPARSVGTDA